MTALGAAWGRYWFRPASLTDLAMARILVAGVFLILNGTTRFLIVGDAAPEVWRPTDLVVGWAKPDAATMSALGLVSAALLACVLFGAFSRLALVVVTPLLFFQEALLMSVGKPTHAAIPALWVILFLALSPCNRSLSVDAAIRGALRRAPDRGGGRSEFAGWPIELTYVVLSGFYFAAGFSKLVWSGFAWADGATLRYHLVRAGTPVGVEMAEWPTVCAILSAAVLAWELTFPLGIWRRWRPVSLAGGVAFHTGTGLAMGIWFWPVLALYLVFVPWSRWRSWAPVARPRPSI